MTVLRYEFTIVEIVDLNKNGQVELVCDVRSINGMYVPDEFALPYADFFGPIFVHIFREEKALIL